MSDTSNTSIHDLLRHEEEAPAGERRARSGLGWLVKTVLYAAAVAALGVLGLRTLGIGVPYALAFSVILALLVLRRLVQLVAPPDAARRSIALRRYTVRDDEASYQWDTVDGLRSAVTRWESRLEWGTANPHHFSQGVQGRMAELVDERLRQRHGITRASDPVRARALLGEPLWTFLTAPVTKPPTPRQLAAAVAQMEEL